MRKGLLILLAVIFFGIWAFVEIADEMLEGEIHQFDEALMLALRTPGAPEDPLGPRWFEEMMRDITGLGGTAVLVLLVLAVLGYFLIIRRYRTALVLIAASLGGIALNSALKVGYGRPRPDLVPHATEVYTLSFPSGHAMLSASIYLTLGALLAEALPTRRLKTYSVAVMVVITLLIGTSRVYLGVHWPSDVLAGWAAGTSWALLWWLVLRYWRRSAGLEVG